MYSLAPPAKALGPNIVALNGWWRCKWNGIDGAASVQRHLTAKHVPRVVAARDDRTNPGLRIQDARTEERPRVMIND